MNALASPSVAASHHHPTHHALHHDAESARRALEVEEGLHRAELERVKARHNRFYAAGRLLVSGLFIVSALVKMARFDETLAAMTMGGMAMPSVLLVIAIGIELIGGLMLAGGLKVRTVAGALICYLAAVTILMHADFRIELNRAFALANLAFSGGLLMLAAHGAGTYSLDRLLRRNA